MGIFELFIVGIGLSMDAFAVAVGKGLCMKKLNKKRCLLIGALFGGFQGGMPLLGWLLGHQFQQYVKAVDHWIAFILLALIGGKMIKDVFEEEEEQEDAAMLQYIKISVSSSKNSEERFFNDNTALIIAAWQGNIKAVNFLLKSGADISAKNMYGMNALMYAAEGGYTEVAAVLLEAGANINDVNNEGSTALMIAAIHGHEEVIRILLNARADTEIQNNNGKTAADYARENETLKDSDVIKKLDAVI